MVGSRATGKDLTAQTPKRSSLVELDARYADTCCSYGRDSTEANSLATVDKPALASLARQDCRTPASAPGNTNVRGYEVDAGNTHHGSLKDAFYQDASP